MASLEVVKADQPSITSLYLLNYMQASRCLALTRGLLAIRREEQPERGRLLVMPLVSAPCNAFAASRSVLHTCGVLHSWLRRILKTAIQFPLVAFLLFRFYSYSYCNKWLLRNHQRAKTPGRPKIVALWLAVKCCGLLFHRRIGDKISG